jgi:hypothetical protein
MAEGTVGAPTCCIFQHRCHQGYIFIPVSTSTAQGLQCRAPLSICPFCEILLYNLISRHLWTRKRLPPYPYLAAYRRFKCIQNNLLFMLINLMCLMTLLNYFMCLFLYMWYMGVMVYMDCTLINFVSFKCI